MTDADDHINDMEAQGANSLKWLLAKDGKIKDAVEMQKIETEALLRIKDEEPPADDPTLAADWWKK